MSYQRNPVQTRKHKSSVATNKNSTGEWILVPGNLHLTLEKKGKSQKKIVNPKKMKVLICEQRKWPWSSTKISARLSISPSLVFCFSQFLFHFGINSFCFTGDYYWKIPAKKNMISKRIPPWSCLLVQRLMFHCKSTD